MKLNWLDEAISDLFALRRYIEASDPEAAQNVARKIQEAVLLLAKYPAIGRPGRVPNTRELAIPGTPYIVPYRVRLNTVEILGILHGARKWPPT